MNQPVSRCARCKGEFPATLDYFYAGQKKYGISAYCKPCAKIICHEHYERNKEAVLKRSIAWRQANREKARASVKKWRDNNPEKRKAYESTEAYKLASKEATKRWLQKYPNAGREKTKRWRDANPLTPEQKETNRQYLAKYRQTNHEELIKKKREHHQKNKTIINKAQRKRYKELYPQKGALYLAAAQRRRALRAGAVIGERFSNKDIAERDHWTCHICHKRVTRRTWSIDHLIPLSKGGEHSRKNVALAHQRCNSSRGAGRLPAQLRLLD